nr:site-specific DNA-methyltransferase [Hyphomonas sp.]
MKIDIYAGDCLDSLKQLEDQSINTCITSPPYWGLRDYGTGEWVGGDPNCPHMRTTKISKDTSTGHKAMFEQGNVVGDAIYKNECPKCGAIRKDSQLGLEDTPEEFVDNLVKVFREVKRVLRDDGTVWLNLGDTYSSHKDCKSTPQSLAKGMQSEVAHVIEKGKSVSRNTKKLKAAGLKNKDLIGIPWRVALALQQDGWYLRQDIIWHKPNPMPESVKDRCTKAHEYIFLLSKSSKYYFDNEAIKDDSGSAGKKSASFKGRQGGAKYHARSGGEGSEEKVYDKKNKRSVWTVTTKPFAGAHFATFPMDLIEPCVLAGCPEKICVDCGTPYKIKPKYKYSSDIEKKDSSFGKYGDQEPESLNRQGMHGKRGEKLIQVRDNLPTQEKLVAYLKKKTNAKTLANSTDLKLSKIEHWFRSDESGFSYPSVEDWEKVREFIDDWSEEFEEIDRGLLDYELKSDAIKSKTLIGHELQKQCDCKTNETKAGTVLDPFAGSGTTGIVADHRNRNAVLLELSEDYIKIAVKRIKKEVGTLFLNLNIIRKKDD